MVVPSAYPQHMNVLIHLNMFGMEVGTIPCRSGASTLNQYTLTSFVGHLWPRNLAKILNIQPTRMVVVAWWWIHLLTTCIWMFSATLYLSGVDVGTIPCGSGASANKFSSCEYGNRSKWFWCFNQCTLRSFVAHMWPKNLAKFCHRPWHYGGKLSR